MARQDDRDISFGHIYNGHHDTLDHILVSEEFFKLNPNAIGEVEYLRFFNDHLVDSTLTDMREDRTISDHGQVVATLRLKEASGPG